MKEFNFGRFVQGTVFFLFVFLFLGLAFGWITVPKDPDTKQLFFGVKDILLTILSVPALAYLVQRGDLTVVNNSTKEEKNEEIVSDSTSAQ